MAKTSKIGKSRKLFDKESWDIYNQLITNNVFQKLTIMEVFSIAMIKGKKEGIRKPLDSDRVAEVNKYTMDNSKSFNYLLMAMALEEENTIDILLDEVKYFEIAEEYAKNGLEILDQDIRQKKDGLLDDMEMELLQVYDSIFDSK